MFCSKLVLFFSQQHGSSAWNNNTLHCPGGKDCQKAREQPLPSALKWFVTVTHFLPFLQLSSIYFHFGWAGKYSFKMLQLANKIFIHAKYYFIYSCSNTSSCGQIKAPQQFAVTVEISSRENTTLGNHTFTQPRTRTQTENLFHIYTWIPLYCSGRKINEISSVCNTSSLSGTTCSRDLVIRHTGLWIFE